MEKKNVLTLGLLFFALIVIGGSVYYLYTTQKNADIADEIPADDDIFAPVSIEQTPYNDLFLTYDYVGNNTWEFQVTGTLPNPCYEIFIYTQIAESLPEQVVISALIQEPSADQMCTEVIQEVSEESTFEASEDAIVNESLQIFYPEQKL